MLNSDIQFLVRLASPSYQAYVEQKGKDGEKPLSKEDWETRVLGKESDSKPDEPKRKMSVEVKGAVMATSESVHASQSKGEEILRKALGDEAASKLIANRKTRDGDKAHVTLISPPDMKKAVSLMAEKEGISKGEAERRVKALVSDGVDEDFTVRGVGKAEKDDKEAYYASLSWPAGDKMRKSLGLPTGDEEGAQDFHITLGFGEGGDVHGARKTDTTVGKTASGGGMNLRSQLIRLAYQQPKLRSDLLPLLRQGADKFEDAVKGKKFRNPDTGSQVEFGSLPDDEQKKLRAKWKDKSGDKPDSTREEIKTSGDPHHVIQGAGGHQVLLGNQTFKHILTHAKPGKGSVFSGEVKQQDIADAIAKIPASFYEGGGGAYEIKVPNAGADLVKKTSDILKKYPNAKKISVPKQEGVEMEDGKPKRGADGNVIPKFVNVNAYVVDDDLDSFSSDVMTVIARPANPQFLPPEAKEHKGFSGAVEAKKGFAVLTAFPGKSDVPKASDWGDDYAVIIPSGGKGADEDVQKALKGGKTASIRDWLLRIAREHS